MERLYTTAHPRVRQPRAHTVRACTGPVYIGYFLGAAAIAVVAAIVAASPAHTTLRLRGVQSARCPSREYSAAVREDNKSSRALSLRAVAAAVYDLLHKLRTGAAELQQLYLGTRDLRVPIAAMKVVAAACIARAARALTCEAVLLPATSAGAARRTTE